MTFRVGQKVVCIDDRPNNWSQRWLTMNTVYTVARVAPLYHGGALFGRDRQFGVIQLIEVPDKPNGFAQIRFRPVVEKSTDAGMAILRKVADDASKQRALTVCGND